jgi:hypothetical protein
VKKVVAAASGRLFWFDSENRPDATSPEEIFIPVIFESIIPDFSTGTIRNYIQS